MKKYKYKQDRKLLQNTFGNSSSSFNKKKYKPGMHKSTVPYQTFYGKLLNQRQKLKAFYANLKDKQLKNLIRKSMSHKDYKIRLIKSLESRIDTILFRSGLVISMGLARQLINHKHVIYQKKYIASPSQKINNNDPINFSNKGIEIIKKHINKIGRSSPSYMFIKEDDFSITVDTSQIPTKESELCFATKINVDHVIRSYR